MTSALALIPIKVLKDLQNLKLRGEERWPKVDNTVMLVAVASCGFCSAPHFSERNLHTSALVSEGEETSGLMSKRGKMQNGLLATILGVAG